MPLLKAQITENRNLAFETFELSVKPELEFKFKAGQFITIKIDDGILPPCFRAYSIASAPNEKELKICVKLIEHGRGSNFLNNLKIGDTIEFMGPAGNFLFKKTLNRKIVFIATGTGVAPMKSMIEYELQNGNSASMHLIFGLRHIKNIFYKDFFDKLAKEHENFHFDITLSRPENNDYKGFMGRVTDYLEKMEIDTENFDFYLCGLKPMIDSVNEILLRKGVKKRAIFFEKYD